MDISSILVKLSILHNNLHFCHSNFTASFQHCACAETFINIRSWSSNCSDAAEREKVGGGITLAAIEVEEGGQEAESQATLRPLPPSEAAAADDLF